MEYWGPGPKKAIARITRLMIEAVPPTRVGTMDHLAKQDSGLRLISTLGGASLPRAGVLGYWLVADSTVPRSQYTELGLRFAGLPVRWGGQPVRVQSAEAAEQYMNGLVEFARRGDSYSQSSIRSTSVSCSK